MAGGWKDLSLWPIAMAMGEWFTVMEMPKRLLLRKVMVSD